MAGLGIDADKVDGAGASGSGTDVRHLLAEQRVNQTGFADVGTAQEGELRRAFRGKELGVSGGGEEFGDGGLHLLLSLRCNPLKGFAQAKVVQLLWRAVRRASRPHRWETIQLIITSLAIAGVPQIKQMNKSHHGGTESSQASFM